MSEQRDTYQPREGDLYILEVHAGRYIIRRYDGQNWEQLGGGHSEQYLQTLTAPMQLLWESEGHRRYYRPTGRDATSTDWQARAEQLEHLLRDCLLYIKELSDYNWRSAPRTIALQDRAAELGIVLELSPAKKYNAMIDARNKILLKNREKPSLPPHANEELYPMIPDH